MTPERWSQVKHLFVLALAKEGPERAAFLKDACASDPQLRESVLELLASDARAGTFLENPAIETVTDAGMAWIIGRQVGPYEIVHEIGRGGMGTVFMGRRNDGQFQKLVAIKLLTKGGDFQAACHRFQREGQILAQLDHPNIAGILDAGITAEGLPYLIMDYVDGIPIDRYCAVHHLDIDERLRLFLGVCSAVQCAHQHKITHRDLKPANILVTAEGIPKLLDFGIARMLKPEVPLQSPDTATLGPQPMTPEYASPEQVRGEPATPASDIYSLGVILFELLTGRRPHNLKGCSWKEGIQIICEGEPGKPSALSGRRELAGSVDEIVLTALRKEPGRRQKSAAHLAEDILRYLERRAVGARQDGLPYRGGKFVLRYWLSLGVAVAGALIATTLFLRQNHPSGPASLEGAGGVRTIAVLPLEDLSPEPRMEHIAETITDSLIGTLGRISALRVISRDSAVLYKGNRKPATQTGRQLHATAVVEGSVLRAGDRLRLSLRLTAGGKDRAMWAQNYDSDLQDISALQVEAARAIARELRIQLTADEEARFSSARRVRRLAYEAYLKGRYHWYKYTEEGFQQAAQYFKEAIEIDPVYAPAWAGLADAYYQMSSVYLDPKEAMPKAKAAAARALAIDDGLAEAHATLALVQGQYEWDWKRAETGFRSAVALKPSYAHGHLYYSIFLAEQGRLEQAIVEAAEASRLDPLPALMPTNLAYICYLARRYEQAVAHFREALLFDPGSTVARYGLGETYARQGRFDEAVAEILQAVQSTPKEASHRERALLAHAYAVAGKPDLARQILGELRQMSGARHIDPYNFAIIEAGLRQRDNAFEWLEKAYKERSEELLLLKVDPRLDSLRSDPRFPELVRRLGLPP
jgi:serine/threonine protein kinase/tetratricopeptide (TPR) repeat protein